jgi:hypothetical protein
MNKEVTLTQLATEMTQLRQQLEQVNQRLDMIYGAVTRLTETKPETAAPKTSVPSLSAEMMMTPASMFESLRQHAVKAGLDIPADAVDQLQSKASAGEPDNGSR